MAKSIYAQRPLSVGQFEQRFACITQYPATDAAHSIENLRFELDPVATVLAPEAAQWRLGKALMLGAHTSRLALEHYTKRNNGNPLIANLYKSNIPNLELDAAYSLARTKHGKATAAALLGQVLKVTDSPDFTQKDKWYRVKDSRNLFTRLSAMALSINLRNEIARESANADRISQTAIATRSLLGGLIHKSVDQLEGMSAMYAERRATDKDGKMDMSGRLFELMIFTNELVKWYRDPDFNRRHVRFGLDREDRPEIGFPKPRRSFDVVTIDHEGGIGLLQMKGGESEAYAQPITMVMRTQSAPDYIANMPNVVQGFKTLLRPSASDKERKDAQAIIDASFEEKHSI